MTDSQRPLIPHVRDSIGDELDFFPTPPEETELFLRAAQVLAWVQEQEKATGSRVTLFDPGAGDGAILDVLAREVPGANIFGFELKQERAAECNRKGHNVLWADFLNPGSGTLETKEAQIAYLRGFMSPKTWFIGNWPGYKRKPGEAKSLALRFTEWALEVARPGDRVSSLLPRQIDCQVAWRHLFLPGGGLLMEHTPCGRISFTGDGQGGQSEVMWATWEKGYEGLATVCPVEWVPS